MKPLEECTNLLSRHNTDLLKADIILTHTYEALADLEVKETFHKRIAERRGVQSDVLAYFTKKIERSNPWFNQPTFEQVESLFSKAYPEESSQQSDNDQPDFESQSLAAKLAKIDETDEEVSAGAGAGGIKEDFVNFHATGSMSMRLLKLVRALKRIQPSSVDAERAFSVCGRIDSPLRTMLSEDKFEKILFLNQNL